MTHQVQAKYIQGVSPARQTLKDLRELERTLRRSFDEQENASRRRLAQKLQNFRNRTRTKEHKSAHKCAKQQWGKLLSKSEEEYSQIVAKANRDCLNLVMGIVQEFVGEHLSLYGASLARQVDTAISELSDKREVEIFVHPNDFNAFSESLEYAPVPNKSCLHTDEAVEPGSARLKTRSGELLFSWKENLDSINKQMTTQLEKKLSIAENSDE